MAKMHRLFDAPNGLILMLDKEQAPYALIDCDLILQNILLLCQAYGIGAVVMAAPIIYPDILRKMLDIPDSKKIVVGVALGYPLDGDPVNEFKSLRDPVENFISWSGF